jgi:hypothetical protein
MSEKSEKAVQSTEKGKRSDYMRKVVEKKSDGRTIIYYTFDGEGETSAERRKPTTDDREQV